MVHVLGTSGIIFSGVREETVGAFIPVVARSKYVKQNLSHEKYPGWLGYIGDYTTQVFRDCKKPL